MMGCLLIYGIFLKWSTTTTNNNHTIQLSYHYGSLFYGTFWCCYTVYIRPRHWCVFFSIIFGSFWKSLHKIIIVVFVSSSKKIPISIRKKAPGTGFSYGVSWFKEKNLRINFSEWMNEWMNEEPWVTTDVFPRSEKTQRKKLEIFLCLEISTVITRTR